LKYPKFGIYNPRTGRSLASSDVFHVVAATRRRQILDLLAGGERRLNEMVAALGVPQPQAGSGDSIPISAAFPSTLREQHTDLGGISFGPGLGRLTILPSVDSRPVITPNNKAQDRAEAIACGVARTWRGGGTSAAQQGLRAQYRIE
jgi:hypothetical protein